MRNRRRVSSLPAFDPVSVSAVTGWLRNGTTGLVSSVPDVLNGGNPATASGANRPTGNANGSMTFASPNFLSWPAVSNNSGTVRFGFAGWINCSIASAPIVVKSGSFQLCFTAAGAVSIDVWSAAVVRRHAESANGVYVGGTKVFWSLEYDGGQASEIDKCFFRLGSSAKLALAFTVNTSMPAVVAAHSALGMGAYGTGGGQAVAGDYGRSLFALQGPGGLSGGGLITAAQFDGLKTVDPL